IDRRDHVWRAGARVAAQRPMLRLIASTLLSATLFSCATDHSDSPVVGGGKGDGTTATLTFANNFTETQDGDLVAGGSVRIVYDLDRLTSCRSESGGSPQWGVSGWAKFDSDAPDASPHTFAVSRLDGSSVVPVTPDLELPASATRVALWFTINDRDGCVA